MSESRKSYTLKADRFEHKAGTTVYNFSGYDYGLARDDTFVTGIPHVSVTLDPGGGWPFFTTPVDNLEEIKS